MKKGNFSEAALLAGVFAVLFLSAGEGVARATSVSIFTNLGSGSSFNTARGYAVIGSSSVGPLGPTEGMPFIAGKTSDLANAVLALGNENSPNNNPLTVDLESDNSGQPGVILATMTQRETIPPAASPGLVTFICNAACPLLSSGQQYWLVAAETDPNSFQNWFYSTSESGDYAVNLSGSATGPWEIHFGQIAAFQVGGTPLTPTPEPANWVLLATGLLGILLVLKCCADSRQSKI